MADYAVQGYVYNGSLLAANLLSQQTTLLLSSFSGAYSCTISDDSDQLTIGEQIQINGNDFVMVASGTAQPGVNLLGLTIPTGLPRDLVVLQSMSTGQLHFVFPDGVPNATGMIAMVIDLEAVGYDLISKGPLCFAVGTLIATTAGPRRVEDLCAGCTLVCPDRGAARVKAVLQVPPAPGPLARNMAVCIHAGALDNGLPHHDLRLSRQHRIAVSGAGLELMFGLSQALIPAAALVDFDRVTYVQPRETPGYVHLLCEQHSIVLAEGVAAETLLWSDLAQDHFGAAEVAALHSRHPELAAQDAHPCLPQLSMTDARILTRAARNQSGFAISIGDPCAFTPDEPRQIYAQR
ncbi:Hint domain-containing protein [Gemmobacter aquatilis]|uniref:Hint domain-containing protein n=1 Tax=Gemmobacter aquatilis TaxID=933059 RepID=A0A1H8L332_9RHOB|nr:Hint domain-containing protein [Gemmobacter aquatilis]SEN99527.1 Hint domain-containing protein [Gemmobacter aquatilis]